MKRKITVWSSHFIKSITQIHPRQKKRENQSWSIWWSKQIYHCRQTNKKSLGNDWKWRELIMWTTHTHRWEGCCTSEPKASGSSDGDRMNHIQTKKEDNKNNHTPTSVVQQMLTMKNELPIVDQDDKILCHCYKPYVDVSCCYFVATK